MTTPPPDNGPQNSSGWTPPVNPDGPSEARPVSFDKPADPFGSPDGAAHPGHPAYPGHQGSRGYLAGPASLQPVAGLGRAALILAGVVTVVEALSAVLGFSYDPTSSWTAYDSMTGLSSLVWLSAFVVTCLWLVRVRRNSESLNPTYHHARRWGWAWAGWLVPVVAFWFPFQVVRDAVTASAGAAPTPGVEKPQRPPFGLWWGAWLAGQFLTNAASSQADVTVGSGDPTTIGGLHLLGVIALVVSLRAWIKIIRTSTTLQSAAG